MWLDLDLSWAVTAAWRAYRTGTAAKRDRIPGEANPPGSKVLRRFYRAKNGTKGTLEEARKWYDNLQDY